MITTHQTALAVVAFLVAAPTTVSPVRAQSPPAPARKDSRVDGLVLDWRFDDPDGGGARDESGSRIDGRGAGSSVVSPAGRARVLDGTAATAIVAQLPETARLGKNSWTVSAWIKPEEFVYPSTQNQRRLFAVGSYPQSFFCVDILGHGAVTLYMVYQKDGKSHDLSADSGTPLVLKQWAQVAVTCDRAAGVVRIAINGRVRGEQKLPPGFDPDLSVSGEFTVGNGFQNYKGLVDEVKLYRRALTPSELRADFAAKQRAFGVVPTAAEANSDARDAFLATLGKVDAAWAKKDFVGATGLLAPLLADKNAPPYLRSYAYLRAAQTARASGDLAATRAILAKLSSETSLPQVHRDEAGQRLRELDRTRKGLPARDPQASRTKLAVLPPVRARLFVAPNGSDSQAGTAASPLATLDAARKKARAIVALSGRGTVEIVFAPGAYKMERAVVFGKADSGRADSPVVYRAQKSRSVTFYGGKRLSGFAPVNDPATLERLPDEARGKVLVCDLKENGVTDFGALSVRGFSQPESPPTVEIYQGKTPQTLARWPNTGFVYPTKLVQSGNQDQGVPSVLEYADERHARWASADDAWIFGYFRFLWADATAKIGKIDPAKKTLTTSVAYNYGGGMDTGQGIKYYAFNLLEEIDSPGEWYLDRKTGKLYLWPAADPEKTPVEINTLAAPMLDATAVSHVRFEGLRFDLGRGDGIVLRDCERVEMVGCEVSRFGLSGVRVLGGKNVTLLSCDIHTLGRRATEILGGDRATLSPGGHTVENCEIHDFGRIDRTYTPGVQLEGVGNRVAHNLFYNCPSSALRIEGNDHVIEYNEVHDVLQESDDQGAMELFRNPTYRGVVFRHNHFHDLGSGGREKLAHGQAAIRLDDAISGVLIYGNVFARAANGSFGAIQMNSGRDNTIDNNLFVDSARGISGGFNAGNDVWRMMADGKTPEDFYLTPLYRSRYPDLALLLTEPATNRVWRNVFVGVSEEISGNRATLELLANPAFSATDPGFMNRKAGNFALRFDAFRPDAPWLSSLAFYPIPLGEIGLYIDIWRK